jgi:hypothetical protein
VEQPQPGTQEEMPDDAGQTGQDGSEQDMPDVGNGSSEDEGTTPHGTDVAE